ncbi:hypothetical protein QQY24_13155 [Streptomyces sp. TG1A-8]|uniref:hypothetical protein n=1 Tax=Streptomyces sp. TG1A-8 TaxID=3051385 RepID=UPI00265BC060|nr:hypothetical protein [Streptomyces sp. TG1A-8]MDO0926325.1 hypothetical protein [Streptomyces sp. TG1A-8]
MRWFRDARRGDIQGELPGWPEGPSFSVRPQEPERPVRQAGLFGLRALYVAVGGALEALGGTGSFLPGSGNGPGRPQEPENEVTDFPVMWAAPGTVARTLPWQLDPGRCPENLRTHIVVTDRRVVVLGLPDGEPLRDRVLWEAERSKIARVERMRFSAVGGEAKVCFTDGSWCRLAPPDPREYWSVLRHLVHPTDLVPVDALTPRQRAYVQSYVATVKEADTSVDPVITRRPSGKLLIEVTTTQPVRSDLGIVKPFRFMGRSGGRGGFDPHDL